MAILNRRSLAFVIIAALLPKSGSAQDLPATRPAVPTTRTAVRRAGTTVNTLAFASPNLHRALARMQADRWSTRVPQKTTPERGSSRIGWAIAIGIGAGATIAGVAASKYGENEGGTFCTGCFAEWSAIAIPVGAGVGAAVGYLLDRARR